MKPRYLDSQPGTSESPALRRSKRLRESDDIRRLKSNDPIPAKPSIRTTSAKKKFAPTGTFPLASLLSLEVPTLEHLLPHLSPDDLSALELVNRDSLQAVRTRRYWKSAFTRFVKDDPVAEKIYQSRRGQTRGNEAEEEENSDPRFYQRLYLKLRAHKRRLEKNIRRGSYKQTSVFLPSERNSVATDASKRFVFAAGENQVDIFAIAETSKGATLRLQYHINWQDALPDHDGIHNGATHAHIMKCQSDFLFVAHYNGLVSVWNWKDQSLVHVIKHHSVPGHELGLMPIFEAMECKQNRIILGLWADEPVTVWKYEEARPSSATLISRIHLQGYSEVKAIDIDAHLAVVAFDRTPSDIHHVCIWDLNKNSAIRFISAPHVQTLSLNVSDGKLLVGSTRVFLSSPLMQMFSLRDGKCVISYQTDEVETFNRADEFDWEDDFIMEGATSLWTDWKSRVIIGFTNGVIAMYDLKYKDPITCLHRAPPHFESARWINDISFDGSYLVFSQETDICLFDFLKLNPSKI